MTLSFQSLGLSETRAKHLESLGFVEPTPIQVQAIPPLLAGNDVVGQAQTGTGKTAAFSLPMLEGLDESSKHVQALVLTPTRELALQVCEAIESFLGKSRLSVTTVYGGQSIDRQIRQLRRGTQIVVGTPGRTIDLMDRGNLKLDRLTWLVLDEADEMLNMGFIQDVEKIIAATPDDRQTTFFSATLSPDIRKLVAKFLRSPVSVAVKHTETSPRRIDQVAYSIPRGISKARALMPLLEYEDPESAIIFVRTKQAASDLTSQLQAAGHSVDEYHGNLNQSQRERLIARFRRGQLRWLVATDIAARGLDVDRVTHVINYDLPDNVENYVHRIGRTGRAGRAGRAIALIASLERYQLRRISRHTGQEVRSCPVPSRADIEAKRIEKLKGKVSEALAGERVASFLPIVAQLSEEYDPHTIAAAALQMAYDHERPNWFCDDDPADWKESAPPRPRSGSGNGNGNGKSRPAGQHVSKPVIKKKHSLANSDR